MINQFVNSTFVKSVKALGWGTYGRKVPLATKIPARKKLRERLADHKNLFSKAIKNTNNQLDYEDQALSDFSANKLWTLCVLVERGEITVKQAHSYEACHWLMNAPESYGACLVGFTGNFIAGIENDNQQRDREHAEDLRS